MKVTRILICLIFPLLFLTACGDDTMLIPKPEAHLRIEFPKRVYHRVSDDCPYSFELPSYMDALPATDVARGSCHKDISLGQFNGVILFSYLPIDTALSAYINYSIKRVQEHQIMATAINDTSFSFPGKKVYGTMFSIEGNAASPFQFYLTDSVKHFVKAEVFFNTRPNYDSIYPVLQYIKADLYHMIGTLEWK